MSTLAHLLGWIAWGLSVAGVLYTILAGVFVQRFFRAPRSGPTHAAGARDGVLLLKPLHCVEPGLGGRLEGFFVQDDAAPMRIIFGSDHAEDPALGIARALASAYPERAVAIEANPLAHGQNRKISNVINMMNQAAANEAHALVILSDSDIGVGQDYLRRVRATLAKPGVGVVTCPYYGEPVGGLWSTLVAMSISYQFLPSVITGVSLDAARPCMGSTIALRRSTLERIGGFDAFRNTLADDYAIGAAVRALGLKSEVAPVLVSHCCSETTFAALFAHELRWARTVRSIHPWGYLGSIVAHPTPIAILTLLAWGVSPGSLGLIAAAFAARIWLMSRVDQVIGRDLGPWWLSPIRDTISFLVFLASFFVSTVEWRGLKFQVTADGDLKPI